MAPLFRRHHQSQTDITSRQRADSMPSEPVPGPSNLTSWQADTSSRSTGRPKTSSSSISTSDVPQAKRRSYTSQRSPSSLNVSLPQPDDGRDGSFTSSPFTSIHRTPSNDSSFQTHSSAYTAHPDAGSTYSDLEEDVRGPRQREQTGGSTRSRNALEKRLGEKDPYLLQSGAQADRTAQAYPGVVIGSFPAGAGQLDFDSMRIDGMLDDIMDTNNQLPPRADQPTGQAGANIAPWLVEDPNDNTASVRNEQAPFLREEDHSLSHSSSTPSLTQARRQGTMDSRGDGVSPTSSRNGSQPSLAYLPSLQLPGTQARMSSYDNPAASGQRGSKSAVQQDEAQAPPSGGRHPSIANTRTGRYGSTVSSASGSGSTGKKGFLGGLLKRKTAQAPTSAALSDFGPAEGNSRASTSGSTSSRLPSSASVGSFTSTRRAPPPGLELPAPFANTFHRPSDIYIPDGMISPLNEAGEPEFTLDMNFNDMDGIVDPTFAQQSQASPSTESATGEKGSTATTSGSMLLQDALDQTGSFASTSGSASGSSGQSAFAPSSRVVVSEGHRVSGDPFTRANPFGPRSSDSSVEAGKSSTPPSPHTMTLLPKHIGHPRTVPRRPSQLRNVKTGSTDSNASSDSRDNGSLQPLAPAWAAASGPSPTMFNDPFGGSTLPSEGTSQRPAYRADSQAISTDSRDSSQGPSGTSARTSITDIKPAVPLASAGLGPGAAWAAPESWGVEGDATSEGSPSSDEDGHWTPGPDSGPNSPQRLPSDANDQHSQLPSPPSGKPPPFGYSSVARGAAAGGSSSRPATKAGRTRTKTANGRPSTSARPHTGGRPGTSGSVQTSSHPHHLRIYRPDGSYIILAFPLNTTTSEIINYLSGNDPQTGRKVTTSMKLYFRERGQDRQLLPSEKPLAIQDRKLRQAGYTDAENVEELGKLDLFTLCKFIYQTPELPVMNPEEESQFDSFEFIDIAGRDLLTIPIFFHLHAHNIIILNVSRNPMTDIPLDFIQACTNLRELRMTHMSLKRIPASICASSTLARLDVSCNRIADLESVPLHEITTLLSLKVQNNRLTSLPDYFVQMKNLKYLNISNNNFDVFPAVLCEMSNLVDLDCSFNIIGEFPSEMSNLKSLERLSAFGNELKTFPASFSTLENLRVLDVRRNNLTDLESVYALPNLTSLQADYNNLVTLDAQIGAKVREFSVPHNSITRFTLASLPDIGSSSYSLTHLNLSHGKISTLSDEALSGLTNLVQLRLDFNQFTRLPPSTSKLVNLQVLSCTDNMLESLPTGIGYLQKLRILNVHNNNIKELDPGLWACGSVESINLSSNLIQRSPETPSQAELAEYIGHDLETLIGPIIPPIMKSLQRLYLADNRYNEDIFDAVAHLYNLRVLNLSFNEIFEIPPGTLSRNEKLEALYLSGNKLTSLPAEDLEKLQNLKVLHLNGNKLQTLPSELGALTSLQHLDVGSNVLKYNIANWPYDWNWNWNTALKYLNLSGNKRLEIKPTSAQDMSHASSFRKELSDFNALTDLRLLGLMDVTLRIPSLPDETDAKRVRTSFSDINNMAYGISDIVGSAEHLAMFDMVVPNFRGRDNECIFGMFGRAVPSAPSGKIPKYIQEIFAPILTEQIDSLKDGEGLEDAIRRTFLSVNRSTFEHIMSTQTNAAAVNLDQRKQSIASVSSVDSLFRKWAPSPTSHFRQGASGAVVYLVDRMLYVGNVGDCLVVLSRKGEAELLSKLHDPTDREETARIRRGEAWVSTKGYINEEKDLDISRAIGYYSNFPAINASPEIRTRQLAESDEFVIIGNHALWKCCSYQTAVDIARTERSNPMMAAQKLRDFAISYGAEGSIMVMVVNVSDLFTGAGQRTRGMPGSIAMSDTAPDQDLFYNPDLIKRNIRRRYEEFGDKTLNRLQQEIEPPQGQVAIVFTDIVNSTYLWETNPGMPTAIKMHHTFMRRQLRLDGGYEVKTEGDSFMVSFQTVPAALLWAFNCQIGLLSQEWPRELLEAEDGKIVHDSDGNIVQRGLRVRMGVHWGAPSCERDPITRRMDYYGPMVNRSARINASADGGQLMASQDVINEVEALREYLDTLDGDGESDLPENLKREVQELKRIGFEVKEMGERKLKGLEVPEKLHLLYPKSLAGRFELSNELRANVEVADTRSLIMEHRLIDIDEVRSLAKLVLRLEALCSTAPAMGSSNVTHDFLNPAKSPTSPISNTSALPSPGLEMTPSKRVVTRNLMRVAPPSYLGPHIREDMNDDELATIIESMTTRMENAMSSLYVKQLGGLNSIMSAFEQLAKTEPMLLMKAMSYMGTTQ